MFSDLITLVQRKGGGSTGFPYKSFVCRCSNCLYSTKGKCALKECCSMDERIRAHSCTFGGMMRYCLCGVLYYIECETGGAYKAVQYARKLRKEVINLAKKTKKIDMNSKQLRYDLHQAYRRLTWKIWVYLKLYKNKIKRAI